MAGMERFTQRARRVLSLAHQEAERAHNNLIDTEHLLIGLMLEEGGVAGRVLRELGMSTERIREVVGRVTTPSENFDPSRMELATKAQEVLEYAVEEARRLGHHYIGTEHLLLGLVRLNCTAMEVLRRLGVNEDQIRRQTRRLLNETSVASQNIPSGNLLSSRRKHEVLILHGQENQKKTIAAFMQTLGLAPVLIDNHHEIEMGLELLDTFSSGVALAVLIWANDLDVEKSVSNKVTGDVDRNIVYELGYFRGKLGRKHTCVLYLDNFRDEVEALSAFTGTVFIPFDTSGKWMTQLAKTIQDIGLKPNP